LPTFGVIGTSASQNDPKFKVPEFESACKGGADVVVQSVEGGTHEWPMNTTTKVNNSEEVWAFFKKFSLEAATPIQTAIPENRASDLRVSYAAGWLHVQGLQPSNHIKVTDIHGRQILETQNSQGMLDLRNHPVGLYRIWLKQGESTQIQSVLVQ
jgi:hypothetical protein